MFTQPVDSGAFLAPVTPSQYCPRCRVRPPEPESSLPARTPGQCLPSPPPEEGLTPSHLL